MSYDSVKKPAKGKSLKKVKAQLAKRSKTHNPFAVGNIVRLAKSCGFRPTGSENTGTVTRINDALVYVKFPKAKTPIAFYTHELEKVSGNVATSWMEEKI